MKMVHCRITKEKDILRRDFYKNLCVNTPYRDFLKKQFGEVLETIPGDRSLV